MKTLQLSRRSFLGTAFTSIPVAIAVESQSTDEATIAKPLPVRLSCNLYSFDEPLTKGQMKLEEVRKWVVDAIGECTTYAGQHGVMLVLQNHADFIQTADDVIAIVRQVNSEWLAVNLDIGSFKIGDPYSQIAQVAPYAATWQIKENLFVNGQELPTDLTKIMQIVGQSGYRGYLPIETLGKGDPRVKVPAFYEKVKKAVEAAS